MQFGDGQSRERTLEALTWTQRFTIGGLADDTLLQQPARLAADDHGVIVLDAMARRVLSFGTGGRLQWSYGRAGAGPDEFQNPQDLKLDGEGRVWVLDPANARITVLTRGGEVMRRIPLDRLGSLTHQFVPLAGAEAIVITANPGAPLVHLAADGQVLAELAFPWAGFAELHPLASQLIAGNAQDASDRWVAAFQMGNGFFTFGGARPLGAGAQYVEHVDFPGVVHEQDGNRTASALDRPRLAARSLSIGETVVYVLFQGDSDVRGRVVDRYALETASTLAVGCCRLR